MMTFLFILSILAMLYGVITFFVNRYQKAEAAQTNRERGAVDPNHPRHVTPTILPYGKILGFSGLGLFTVIILIDLFLIRIDGQHVGVVQKPNGVSDDELHAGWHIIPFWWRVEELDKTVQVYTFSTKSGDGTKKDADAIWVPTKDGIKMGFDVSVSWRIDPEHASWIYANVSEMDDDPSTNTRYVWIGENIIRAKTKSELALTVSNYTPIEVYSTKREEIQDHVIERLKKELALKHIILDQVDIREVFYNSDYEKAINNKKLAEQETFRLEEVTKQKLELEKQAEINKNIAIQQAQGEAEALKIKGQSINQNPKIVELEWINKWNGQLPTYMMGQNGSTMMMVNPK